MLRSASIQVFEQVGNELEGESDVLIPFQRIFVEMCKVKEKSTTKAKAMSFLTHVSNIESEWLATWGKHMIRYLFPDISDEHLQLNGNSNLDHWRNFANGTITKMAEQFFEEIVFASAIQAPLALVFDSAQWLDVSSWDVIRRLHTTCNHVHQLMIVLAMRQFEERYIYQAQTYSNMKSSQKFLELHEVALQPMDQTESM